MGEVMERTTTRRYQRRLPMSRTGVVHLPDCRHARTGGRTWEGWVSGQWAMSCAVCLPDGLPHSRLVDEELPDGGVLALEEGGWTRLGFTGLFCLTATLPEDDAAADALVARMPYFTPGQRDRMVTACEGERDEGGRRTAVLVVRDDSAFMAAFTQGGVR